MSENLPPVNLLQRDARSVWHPYTQHQGAAPFLPVQSASGPWIYTEDGRPYLDMISSWWVNIHGHGSRFLADAIHAQCLALDHVQFAGITHEPAVQLAEKLIARAAMGDCRVFYSDNGSTAVEVALKIAHQYWVNRNEKRPLILALEGGYHGDTVGAMSLGRSSGFFNAFEDLFFEVHAIPVPETWHDHIPADAEEKILTRLEAWLKEKGASVSALIVEPLVQGAAGMRFHSHGFLEKLCSLVRSYGILVVFDEVMTGFYRLGTFFALQQTAILPDLLCLSKGITGGILPLGATLAQSWIFEGFLGETFQTALAHGHSFTGNPICCAAALASLTLLEDPEFPVRLNAIHRALERNVLSLKVSPRSTRHRCLGTVAAFDLASTSARYGDFSGRPLAHFARENGVLIRPIGNVVYVLPPYCVTSAQIDSAFDVIRAWLASPEDAFPAYTPPSC